MLTVTFIFKHILIMMKMMMISFMTMLMMLLMMMNFMMAPYARHLSLKKIIIIILAIVKLSSYKPSLSS